MGALATLSPDVMNSGLTAYLQRLYDDGLPATHGTDLIAGTQTFYPMLRGLLRPAWHAQRVWGTFEPTSVRVPMSLPVVRAIAAFFVTRGWPRTAASLLLASHGLLRPGEIGALEAAP